MVNYNAVFYSSLPVLGEPPEPPYELGAVEAVTIGSVDWALLLTFAFDNKN